MAANALQNKSGKKFDRWGRLPKSNNIEDRRGDKPDDLADLNRQIDALIEKTKKDKEKK